MNHMKQEIISTAMGKKELDLLLKNARIIDVYSGEIIDGNIGVFDGYIVGLGDHKAAKIIDLKGHFVAPGFVDSHVHIESSMVSPPGFAEAVLPFGTTAVVTDPHEIANVLGKAGIQYMFDSAINLPLNIYFCLPSCVPATSMETAGARLEADDLLPFLDNNKVVALGEMMNYPGVINADPGVLKKIKYAKKYKKVIDGHAPGLKGKDLQVYVAAGITSDHECTTAEEAIEKLNAGMHIMIREGTGAKNLKALLPVVNKKTYQKIMWCTDDRHPHDLLELGHVDSIVRAAIKMGLDPVTAIRMATINPATRFGLDKIGAIAPGKRADFIIFSDLAKINVETVYVSGSIVAQAGEMVVPIKQNQAYPESPMNIIVENLDFSIIGESEKINVIDIVPGQLVTGLINAKANIKDNLALADVKQDILKIAVIERYSGAAGTGIGFVRGFNLKKGAIASSVAHDSHNIIVVGTNDTDMKAAVRKIIKTGGGLAAALDGKILANIELPIGGLMSEEPLSIVRDKLDILTNIVKEFGTSLSDPFMTLSFLALPVIPDVKITDKGLVDVNKFDYIPVFT